MGDGGLSVLKFTLNVSVVPRVETNATRHRSLLLISSPPLLSCSSATPTTYMILVALSTWLPTFV
jgi:hypothetical protein